MRISRIQMFMEMAHVAAKRSTCFRLNVGAILVNQFNNIISMGYNGPPSGEAHCLGNSCVPPGAQGCVRAIHAEQNALRRAGYAEEGEHRTLFVTHSPCQGCAAQVLDERNRVATVFYGVEYRNPEPIKFMTERGIRCYRVSPSGYIIDPLTNEIMNDE